jgi:hypothetical protein
MDAAEVIADVISSGAVVTATYQIIKGLKTRLSSLEQVVNEQRGYIKEMRDDFKELSSIKSAFIKEFSDLHLVYKDHSEKTYKEIIEIKETEISMLKSTKTPKAYSEKDPELPQPKKSSPETFKDKETNYEYRQQ